MLKNGYFYDWLSISQDHNDCNLPIVCSKIRTVEDLETGEIIQTRQALAHEGSYSTVISISSDGNRVSVFGNPSRFNRLDNLFGYSNLDDCVKLYNELLVQLGLPPFNKVTKITPVWNPKFKKFDNIVNGAVIRQVHVTKNFSVGPGNEKNFIRSLGSYAYRSKLPMIYPNGNTIDWNAGSRTVYIKLYVKSHSLSLERKKLISRYTEKELDYYDRVTKFCKDNGVVRLEYEFKSNFLATRNLRYYGVNDMNKLLEFNFVENKIEKMETVVTDYTSVADELIMQNIVTSRQAANATQAYFFMWLHGQDIRKTLKRSQFYTHRNRLLELGYDIADQINVSTMPCRIKNNRTISISDLSVPSFYLVA